MPSGAIRRVQGYEPYAIRDLLKNYTEEQILTNRKDIPRITYTVEDTKHYYFPDIYIPHINTIIEVKSLWTFHSTLHIHLKSAATREAGYIYEIWIFDSNGNRIPEPVAES